MVNTFQRLVGAAVLGASLLGLAACPPQAEAPRTDRTIAQLPHADSSGHAESVPDTSEVMHRFNQAFVDHDPNVFPGLVAQDCVMESMQPAPNGTRYEGYDVNLSFWQALAADRSTWFETEEMTAAGDRGIIRWRIHFGEGQSLRGVTLLRVRDGKIAEALAYSKVPGEPAPLPSTSDEAQRDPPQK